MPAPFHRELFTRILRKIVTDRARVCAPVKTLPVYALKDDVRFRSFFFTRFISGR